MGCFRQCVWEYSFAKTGCVGLKGIDTVAYCKHDTAPSVLLTISCWPRDFENEEEKVYINIWTLWVGFVFVSLVRLASEFFLPFVIILFHIYQLYFIFFYIHKVITSRTSPAVDNAPLWYSWKWMTRWTYKGWKEPHATSSNSWHMLEYTHSSHWSEKKKIICCLII